MSAPLVIHDGCYNVMRGRCRRHADPSLDGHKRQEVVVRRMNARSAVGRALRSGDGAPDVNRRMARTTSYADWFAALETRA